LTRRAKHWQNAIIEVGWLTRAELSVAGFFVQHPGQACSWALLSVCCGARVWKSSLGVWIIDNVLVLFKCEISTCRRKMSEVQTAADE
jgi:hypothetical protein